MVTVTALFNSIKQRLGRVMTPCEAEASARIILEDVAGYDRNYLWVNGDRSVLDSTQALIEAAVAKVEQGTPVQYAVGKALFMGNFFSVNDSTLIPRPETAGLVDLVTDTLNGMSDLRVLDVGTGSGCIAIELAKTLPFSSVTGWDISEKALETARSNATSLKTKVTFEKQDILAQNLPQKHWNVIVSNPPYICESEKAQMDANVLEHEPHSALFVPDNDPLKFYKAIAVYAQSSLESGGWLFFEINQTQSEQMKKMLTDSGFVNVDVLRDFKGNWRYAKAQKAGYGA